MLCEFCDGCTKKGPVDSYAGLVQTVPEVTIVASGVTEGPSVTILAKCFEICSNKMKRLTFLLGITNGTLVL